MVARLPRRKKQPRTLTYHCISTREAALEIRQGRRLSGYFVRGFPSDWGTAFRLEKYLAQRVPDEPDSYDVLIDTAPDDPTRPEHSCECWGWIYRHRCKHVAALVELIARGLVSTG